VVARVVVFDSPSCFDYKKFFSEKTLLAKPDSLKWVEPSTTKGNKPSKRFKLTANVIGKHIIFVGGQETDTKRFNDVYFFDTTTRTFTKPNIKGDRVPNFSRHTSCLVGNKLYIFGGFDGHGTNFGLAILDPYDRKWTNVPLTSQQGTPPPSRTNHAAAVVGTKMFIFGGNNNSEKGQYQVLNDLSMLETRTMTWSAPATTGDIPCARSGHSLTAIGKKLYLFGGGVWNAAEGWVKKFNDVHILDTDTMHWTLVQGDPDVDTSTFPMTYAIGRFLFVFGGGSRLKTTVTNDLYIFDTALLSWAKTSPTNNKPNARDMGTATVVKDTVYFLGGFASGAMDFFDELSVSCGPSLSAFPSSSGSGSACC